MGLSGKKWEKSLLICIFDLDIIGQKLDKVNPDEATADPGRPQALTGIQPAVMDNNELLTGADTQ